MFYELLQRSIFSFCGFKMILDTWKEITSWLNISQKIYSINIFVCVFNIITAVLTISGSVLTIAAIGKISDSNTPSYTLIKNLALSGVFMGLFCQPPFVAFVFFGTKSNTTLYGYLGLFSGFLIVATGGYTTLVMTAISLDRLLAVFLQLRYRVVVTVERIKWITAAAAFVSLIMASTFVIRLRVLLIISVAFVIFVTTFMVINYACIIRKLQRHRVQIHGQEMHVHAQRIRDSLRFQKTERGMKTLCSVFIVSYFPYVVNTCLILLNGRNSQNHACYILTLSLVMASYSLNPIVYYWKIQCLRKAMHHVLCFSGHKHNRTSIYPSSTLG